MTLHIGGQVSYTSRRGEVIEYTVTAIRRFPIPFAELTPRAGGPTRTMRLSELERMMSKPGAQSV